ncbi:MULTISPECIES: Hint domain-containing protein [unclassified Frankia]|uniref:Hint domain-containing protein n=1 Tax=unclassified Frankia TaxID=2632575 RepID=UPI002AD4B427|nr:MULTISPECIES: Hint domain-containing protein [unclassified Frankia]
MATNSVAASGQHRSWLDRGLIGRLKQDVVQVVEPVANVASYLLQNPRDAANLGVDLAGVAVGVGLTLLGVGMDTGGVLLLATGVGAPAGVAVIAEGTAVATVGGLAAAGYAEKYKNDFSDVRDGVRESSAKSCELNSFDGATEVLMADGSRKPIRDVRVGDRVRATDPATGRTEDHTVTAVIVGEGDKTLVAVTVRTGEGQRVITATDHHPFWDQAAHDWVAAIDLHPGEVLRTPDGGLVPVVGTRTFHRVQRVFNLTVEGLHTYYVEAGATPVLVHNAPPVGCGLTSPADAPVVNSKTVGYGPNRSWRIDVENQNPGTPSAGIHLQLMGRGATKADKYYLNPSTGEWISKSGKMLSEGTIKQIPQNYIDKAYQYLGIVRP